MTETTTISIPGIDDYRFNISNETGSMFPEFSTFNNVPIPTGEVWRSLVVPTSTDPAKQPGSGQVAAPGRVVNIVADALDAGWLVTVTSTNTVEWHVVAVPSAESFAASLWLAAHKVRSELPPRCRADFADFAFRFHWVSDIDNNGAPCSRFDPAFSGACELTVMTSSDTIDVHHRWPSPYLPVSAQPTMKNLRESLVANSPHAVIAKQRKVAVEIVQAQADEQAAGQAAAEYAATGLFQFDDLRERLSEIVEEAERRTVMLAEASGRSFAQGHDSSAAEQRLRSRGWAHVGEWVASALAHEGDISGTRVRDLGSEITETLSTFADYGLGGGGDRSPEYAEAYRILSDSIAYVAKVSRPTVTVTV